MGGPKEDPEETKRRERETRLATIERRDAAQENARGLTSDLRGVYGIAKTPSMFTR